MLPALILNYLPLLLLPVQAASALYVHAVCCGSFFHVVSCGMYTDGRVQLKMQKGKENSVSGQHTAQQPPPFTPHDLKLQPGDVVTGEHLPSSSSGSSSGGSSSSSGSNAAASYRLVSEVHRGPRSAVWRATESGTDTPVALKVMFANHNISSVLFW
jgi:hypothetical protein